MFDHPLAPSSLNCHCQLIASETTVKTSELPARISRVVVGWVVIVALVIMVYEPVLEAEPAGLVTDTTPVVPAPTIALICVLSSTVKELTAVPPMKTAEVPPKFVPVITTVPTLSQPLEGVKEVIVGTCAVVVKEPPAIQSE